MREFYLFVHRDFHFIKACHIEPLPNKTLKPLRIFNSTMLFQITLIEGVFLIEIPFFYDTFAERILFFFSF